jgi:hypothetical protein
MFAHIISIILVICGGNLADVTSSFDNSDDVIVMGNAVFAVDIGGELSGIERKSDSNLHSRLSNFSQITTSLWLQIPQLY